MDGIIFLTVLGMTIPVGCAASAHRLLTSVTSLKCGACLMPTAVQRVACRGGKALPFCSTCAGDQADNAALAGNAGCPGAVRTECSARRSIQVSPACGRYSWR
jgi:hypothetical protein